MPKPRRPIHRVNLTLDQAQFELLRAFAKELGKPPATLAGQIVLDVLGAAEQKPDGRFDPEAVAARIRALRGETPGQQASVKLPIWRWPLELLLGQRQWWNDWYPQLCQLLGRRMEAEGRSGGVYDRAGYSDVMEFLFPTIAGPNGATSWRSPLYPGVAEARRLPEDEGVRPLAEAWEACVRHVAVALNALEETESGSALIILQDQIRHSWLSTLLNLVGEASPGGRPPRLPQKRIV